MEENEGIFNQDILKTRICPDCNMLLNSEYTPNRVTFACSLLLCIGLACWVPFALDACQRLELKCEHCEKIVMDV